VKIFKLPTDLLDDGIIRPGDYTDWASARWVIRKHPHDRELLDLLMEDIPVNGMEEPLTVGVYVRAGVPMYLSDGHHRAVAAFELGLKTVPCRWFWRHPGPLKIKFERGIPPYLEGRL
jgi:hypothetical protein